MHLIGTQILLASATLALWDNTDNEEEIFNSTISMFADKTLMIDTFFQHAEVTSKYQIFTAPLGFGKTTNLKMLKRFVQIEIDEFGEKVNKKNTSGYKLFTDKRLKISTRSETIKAHLAEYPVFYFDLSDVMEFTLPNTFTKLCAKIRELFKSYEWIYEILRKRYSDKHREADEKFKRKLRLMGRIIESKEFGQGCIQKDCLGILVEIIYKYFQRRVFVFIEYYDRYWLDRENHYCRLWDIYIKANPINEHCYHLVHLLFQPEMEKYIEYVFASGTHPIYLENDNFTYNTFLGDHPFTRYYGFVEEEVTKILYPRAKAPITQLRELRTCHNGYTTKTGGLKLFHSSSIINYFQPSSFENHETEKNTMTAYESRPYLLIDPPPLNGHWRALEINSIRQKVRELVTRGNITFELRFETVNRSRENSLRLKNEFYKQKINMDLFFSMLFENGFLTYTTTPGCYGIPNESRFKRLMFYLEIFENRQPNEDRDRLEESWREYMKQNRLL